MVFVSSVIILVLPGGSLVKNLPANTGDAGLIRGSRRYPGGGGAKMAEE